MGKYQALLAKLGQAQETPVSPNFAVSVGTSPAISSCPRPIVYLWPIHQRGSLRFSVMNSLLPTLLSLSFRHVTAHNFKSMYTLGFSTVLFRGRMWPQRAGQLSHTANCSSLRIQEIKAHLHSNCLPLKCKRASHVLEASRWSRRPLIWTSEGLCLSQSASSETCCHHRSREGSF